jgi:hypothetical protein
MSCKHPKPVCQPPVYCRGFNGATGPTGVGVSGLSGATGPTGVGGGGLFSKTESSTVPGGVAAQSIVGVGTGTMGTTSTIADGDQYLYTTGGILNGSDDTFSFIYVISPMSQFPIFAIKTPLDREQSTFKLEVLYTFLSSDVIIAATLTVGSTANNTPATIYQNRQAPVTSPAPRTFDILATGGTLASSNLVCDYGVLTKPF